MKIWMKAVAVGALATSVACGRQGDAQRQGADKVGKADGFEAWAEDLAGPLEAIGP